MKNKLFYGKPPAERQNKFPRTFLAAIAATAMMAAFTGCSPQTDNDQKAASITVSNVTLTAAQQLHIHLYTVASSQFHQTVEATGAVDFDNDQATSVLAPFGGPVTRLLVSIGDQVKKGDPLAVVESPDFATAISAYRTALATAKTDRQVADLDKDLFKHHGISQRESDQAQTDAISAEANRDATLQALAALNVDPQIITNIQAGKPVPHIAATIRSPIDGTVVEKLITPGQLLQAGTTPCFTVANLSRVWVMAQLFGSDLISVHVGDAVEVETGAGTNNLPGTVDNISAMVDPDTRSVMVRVVVENPGDVLKKQMYVRVRIQSRQQSTGLLVPDSAILRDDVNLPFVYVTQPDGSFVRRQVTLGNRVGNQYDISDGLHVGDQVVVDGAIFVQFMQNQ